MSKSLSRREFVRLAGLTGVAAAAVGCSSPAPPEEAEETDSSAASGPNPDEQYVMVSNVAAHPYWLDAQYGGEDAAEELGVSWRYTGPDDFDTPAQVSALEQIIGTEPAGIIVAALQPDAITAAIDQAIEAGIPLVTVDTDAPASKRMTYLGTNNYQAGRTMGLRMIEELGGEGQVGLASVPGQFNLEERIRGIEDVFAEETEGAVEVVRVVDDKNDDAATTDAVVAMLQANPDIDLVGSINAVGAGVAAALRQTDNVGKVKAVTFDITEPIIAGLESDVIDSTMVQRTYMMTYVGVKLLYSFNHRSEYLENWFKNNLGLLPNGVDTGVMAITKDQVAAFK